MASDAEKGLALLKSLAAEHEVDRGSGDHAWRRCRVCLARESLDHEGVPEQLRALIAEIDKSARAPEPAPAPGAAAETRRKAEELAAEMRTYAQTADQYGVAWAVNVAHRLRLGANMLEQLATALTPSPSRVTAEDVAAFYRRNAEEVLGRAPAQAPDAAEKRFKVIDGARIGIPDIPWSVIAPHEAQAQKNHDQSLERLNERGGLDSTELLAVLTDRCWSAVFRLSEHNVAEQLRGLLAALSSPTPRSGETP